MYVDQMYKKNQINIKVPPQNWNPRSKSRLQSITVENMAYGWNFKVLIVHKQITTFPGQYFAVNKWLIQIEISYLKILPKIIALKWTLNNNARDGDGNVLARWLMWTR